MAAMAASGPSALQRFAAWYIQGRPWWWDQETSLLACHFPGALQSGKAGQLAWAEPIFDAFLAGAWLVRWTGSTLYWVAKPTLHMERSAAGRRFHHSEGAAFESDVESLYYWHGVLVPDFVVLCPERITAKIALEEENAEVRRVMIERMGMERFLAEAGAKKIHTCEDFTHPESSLNLFSVDLPGDPERRLRVLGMKDPSTGRRYFLRVPPSIDRADDAKAWTFGFDTAKHFRVVSET